MAGPALAHGLQLLPQRWRRTTEWLLIAGALIVAVLAALSAAGLWASLIGVSALYTKQHYVADVIVGALAAYIASALFLRSYPREAAAESDRRRAPAAR